MGTRILLSISQLAGSDLLANDFDSSRLAGVISFRRSGTIGVPACVSLARRSYLLRVVFTTAFPRRHADCHQQHSTCPR